MNDEQVFRDMFATKLKEIMDRRHLTIKLVAGGSRLPKKTICQYLNGNRPIDWDEVKEIALVVGLNYMHIF